MTTKQIAGIRKHFSLTPNHELVAMWRVTRVPIVKQITTEELHKRGMLERLTEVAK